MSTHTDANSRTASPEPITPALLRGWPLPEIGESKYGRGAVLVVGGAARTPGAAMLSGLAALRVGAGRLSLAVAETAAVAVAVAMPEAGVTGLPQTGTGSVCADLSAVADEIGTADVVLVGPGLDDPELTADLVRALIPMLGDDARLVADAYALGVLPGLGDAIDPVRGRLVLTPNRSEGARLLGDDADDGDDAGNARAIADRYGAVVALHQVVAEPSGRAWQVSTGHGGLATSGSGDVLAGAVSGLLARGAPADQAACWAAHLHATAGDRLTARVGAVGYLARELLDEIPMALVELST